MFILHLGIKFAYEHQHKIIKIFQIEYFEVSPLIATNFSGPNVKNGSCLNVKNYNQNERERVTKRRKLKGLLTIIVVLFAMVTMTFLSDDHLMEHGETRTSRT